MTEPSTDSTSTTRAGTAPVDTTSTDTTSADADLSYEDARDELVTIVRTLESGGTSLAETMTLWERGEKLAAICQTWLDGARQRIDEARSRAEDTRAEETRSEQTRAGQTRSDAPAPDDA